MPIRVLLLSLVLLMLAGGLALKIALVEPRCSGRIVESDAALVRSNVRLGQVAHASNEAKCAVYSERVSLLRNASSLGSICGAAQLSKGELWRNADAEAKAYEDLLNQTCGGSVPVPQAEQRL